MTPPIILHFRPAAYVTIPFHLVLAFFVILSFCYCH